MRTALVVDDEPHIVELVKAILSEMAYSPIYEASNGLEALALIKQHQPNLLLLDINMPKMNGKDLLKQVKKEKSDVKIIMLTSNDALAMVDECLDNGADNYILKNNDVNNIMKIIEATCEKVKE